MSRGTETGLASVCLRHFPGQDAAWNESNNDQLLVQGIGIRDLAQLALRSPSKKRSIKIAAFETICLLARPRKLVRTLAGAQCGVPCFAVSAGHAVTPSGLDFNAELVAAAKMTLDYSLVIALWDAQGLCLPDGMEPITLVKRVSQALRNNERRGPLCIRAYGDMHFPSSALARKLESCGIKALGSRDYGCNLCPRELLADLLLWTWDHRPPATLVVLVTDPSLAPVLEQLSQRGYFIVLVTDGNDLQGVADMVWDWHTLLATGETVPPPLLAPDPEEAWDKDAPAGPLKEGAEAMTPTLGDFLTAVTADSCGQAGRVHRIHDDVAVPSGNGYGAAPQEFRPGCWSLYSSLYMDKVGEQETEYAALEEPDDDVCSCASSTSATATTPAATVAATAAPALGAASLVSSLAVKDVVDGGGVPLPPAPFLGATKLSARLAAVASKAAPFVPQRRSTSFSPAPATASASAGAQHAAAHVDGHDAVAPWGDSWQEHGGSARCSQDCKAGLGTETQGAGWNACGLVTAESTPLVSAALHSGPGAETKPAGSCAEEPLATVRCALGEGARPLSFSHRSERAGSGHSHVPGAEEVADGSSGRAGGCGDEGAEEAACHEGGGTSRNVGRGLDGARGGGLASGTAKARIAAIKVDAAPFVPKRWLSSKRADVSSSSAPSSTSSSLSAPSTALCIASKTAGASQGQGRTGDAVVDLQNRAEASSRLVEGRQARVEDASGRGADMPNVYVGKGDGLVGGEAGTQACDASAASQAVTVAAALDTGMVDTKDDSNDEGVIQCIGPGSACGLGNDLTVGVVSRNRRVDNISSITSISWENVDQPCIKGVEAGKDDLRTSINAVGVPGAVDTASVPADKGADVDDTTASCPAQTEHGESCTAGGTSACMAAPAHRTGVSQEIAHLSQAVVVSNEEAAVDVEEQEALALLGLIFAAGKRR